MEEKDIKKLVKRLPEGVGLVGLDLESAPTYNLGRGKVNSDYQKIVQISLVKIENTKKDYFENKTKYVLPIVPNDKGFKHIKQYDTEHDVLDIHEDVVKIHGIDNDKVKDEFPFYKYAKSFFNKLEGEYVAVFNGYVFDIPLLNQEFKFSKKFVDFDYNLRSLKIIDTRRVYQKYESERCNVKTLDDLLKLYFPDDESTLFVNVKVSDKVDILMEKQMELFDIKTNAEYFDLATSKRDDIKLEELPISVHYAKNPNNLAAVYEFYTGKEFQGDQHDSYYDTLATIEILLTQMKKYKLTLQEIYNISKEGLVDFDNKLTYNDKGQIVLNFGKYTGKTIKEIKYEVDGKFGKGDNWYIENVLLGKDRDNKEIYRLKENTRLIIQHELNKK